MINLDRYAENVYSQNGEDGILAYIFERISGQDEEKWCVEFGAWDGKHLSNTFHLVTLGWNAVYIEADKSKYRELLRTAEAHRNIFPVNALVSFTASDKNSLDNILLATPLPENFQLLSIDIDSFDLAVWQASQCTPQVIVVEINSSIMPGIVQWHDGKNFQGNSFSATVGVARSKSYSLVGHTGNLFFVRDDRVASIGLDARTLAFPESLFKSDWIKPTWRRALKGFVTRVTSLLST